MTGNDNHRTLALAPLPWQHTLWSGLMDRMAQGRLPHALLLHGAAGVGKSHLAHLFAARLLCEQPAQDLPCGHCHGCTLLAAGSHPDFFLASPAYGAEAGGEEGEESSASAGKKSAKARKAQPSRQIRIDCIRDLVHFSQHAAHQGGRRVALIEPAEALNHNAANALLKTLEEPGKDLVILLVSHQFSRLLPTLRSRCQAIFCREPETTVALSWLAGYVSEERAEFALRFSQGAPLRALQVIDTDEDARYKQVIRTLLACREGQQTYLSAAEELEKQDAAQVVDWWLKYVYAQCRRQLAQRWMQFADQLIAARRKLQGTANPDARLLLEVLLVDWLAL